MRVAQTLDWNKNFNIDAVHFDFSKTFDKVLFNNSPSKFKLLESNIEICIDKNVAFSGW